MVVTGCERAHNNDSGRVFGVQRGAVAEPGFTSLEVPGHVGSAVLWGKTSIKRFQDTVFER